MKWFKIFANKQAAEQKMPVNHTQLVIIQGKRICLARTARGFLAIEDACPHMGESLSNGHINYMDEVTCPWHSYRYSLRDGKECENRTGYALIYPVKIDESGLYIGIDKSY